MGIEASKALVRRYMEMWNTGRVELADEVLAPDWRDHAHPEVSGPESVKQAVSQIRATTPDFSISIESIIGEGDLVALRGTVRRTRQEAEVASRVMWFVRVANGKMQEMWTGTETAR